MRRSDFTFDLPADLIAQVPLSERSASRLLVLQGGSGALQDALFTDLAKHLQAGDLLVFNDTRVVPARVYGSKPSGGRVEIFLERQTAERRALVQMRASKAIQPGLQVHTGGGVAMCRCRRTSPALTTPPIASAIKACLRGCRAQWLRPPPVCILIKLCCRL